MQRFKYRMEENSDEGIVIVGIAEDNNVIAKLSVHFCETKTCLLPDDELEKLANTNAEAAVNVESAEFFSDVLRMECLYIAENCRNAGVGTFLLKKSQKYADLRKFPLVVSVFPLARGLTGKPYKKNSPSQQEIRRLFWFFQKNGFKNRAIEYAMKKHMKLPEWFYGKPRDFYYIPESLKKKGEGNA